MDAFSVRQPLRRRLLLQGVVIDRHDGTLAAGTIETAISERASNVVLLHKKDGILRFCIDYQQLSERTKKYSYTLPRRNGCLDTLTCGGWFSTLDLRNGYHQVALDPRDADKNCIYNVPWHISLEGHSFWPLQRSSDLPAPDGYCVVWSQF